MRDGPSGSPNSVEMKRSSAFGAPAMNGAKYRFRKSRSVVLGWRGAGGGLVGGLVAGGNVTVLTSVTARTTLSAGTTLPSSLPSWVASGRGTSGSAAVISPTDSDSRWAAVAIASRDGTAG